MSDTIQGARTRNYIKENVPGIQNSGDTLEYATIQEAPGKRGALDAVIHGSFTVSTGHAIEAGSVKRLIKSTAHGAQKGWIMRPSSGASKGEEIAIVNVVDANTFVIAEEFDLALADTFSICRLITPNYTEDGDLVTASGPVQFLKDTVITTVEEDTVTPANNEALPTKMFIEIDGVVYPVRKDTVVPANTVSVPVEITGASGPINITAGDLNVQLSDQGPNADVTRIGNGTNRWGINASNEGLVHDADAVTELGEINTEITQLNTKTPNLGQALEAASVPVVLTALQLAAITPPAAITGFSLETTQSAISGKLPATLGSKADADSLAVGLSTEDKAAIGAVNETAPVTDIAASGLNGRLQRIAQRLTSLIDLFPASIGAKTSAGSLSVVLATDQIALVTTETAGTATSVQVSVTTGVGTEVAPLQAKWCKIYADKLNTDDIRIMIGGTVTNTTGIAIEAGRSEDFMVAGDISHVSVSGNQKFNVTWRQ